MGTRLSFGRQTNYIISQLQTKTSRVPDTAPRSWLVRLVYSTSKHKTNNMEKTILQNQIVIMEALLSLAQGQAIRDLQEHIMITKSALRNSE